MAMNAADRLLLAPTLPDLGDDPRRGLDRVAELGFRAVQVNAAQRGLRPRELDGSARRDLLARLRRLELTLGGLELWVPPAHFDDPARVDLAVERLLATVRLAADLGRVPVSVRFPADGSEAVDLIVAEADRHGVTLADHRIEQFPPPEPRRVGLDPAAWLAAGEDPVAVAISAGERLVSARLVDLLQSGARGPVGDEREGRLDVQAYRVALSVSGGDPAVVVDARQWPDAQAGLRQTRSVWESAAKV